MGFNRLAESVILYFSFVCETKIFYSLADVLWSDEKWWSVDAPANRSMDGVWCEDPSEVPNREEKKWGSKVLVWGGFTAQGVLDLVFLPQGESFNGEF